jgi:hypothetical protein
LSGIWLLNSGVSQKAVLKGLKILAERRLVKVLTTLSGTVITRLR